VATTATQMLFAQTHLGPSIVRVILGTLAMESLATVFFSFFLFPFFSSLKFNNIAPCAVNPCLNGGTCLNISNIATCNCKVGFAGLTCNSSVTCPFQDGSYCSTYYLCDSSSK